MPDVDPQDPRSATAERSAGSDVVGLTGGLGNQLFQYAFALWLERRTDRKVRLDLSAYRRRPEYLGLHDLGLGVDRSLGGVAVLPHPFGRLDRRLAVLPRILIGPRAVHIEDRMQWRPSTEQLSRPAWWYGYWQHLEVVDVALERIRSEVQGRLAAVAPETRVAMHVRRGDMVEHPWGTLDAEYYGRALAQLRTLHDLRDDEPVSVFSDDPDWCRQNLNLPAARFVRPADAATDLLRLAAHPLLVLSGSTFSWWAALLQDRPAGTVVAPHPFTLIPGQVLGVPGWVTQSRDLAAVGG